MERKHFFVLPDCICDFEAYQLYINGLTAWILLTEIINIKMHDILIINAANSSIGKLFIQLAKSLNITIIASTTSNNIKDLYEHGADYIINANLPIDQQIKTMHIPKPNIALDAVGGGNGFNLLSLLRQNSRFIIYGCLSMKSYPDQMIQTFRNKNISPERFFLRNWENRVSHEFKCSKMNQLVNQISNNNIKMTIHKTFDLKDFKKAINYYLLKNKKVILT